MPQRVHAQGTARRHRGVDFRAQQRTVFAHPPALVERLKRGRGMVGPKLTEAVELTNAERREEFRIHLATN